MLFGFHKKYCTADRRCNVETGSFVEGFHLRVALQKKVLGEGGKPVDCRIEDQKRTGQEFEDAKKALGDLARSEKDIMSYICYPDQTVKFLENRKAQEVNEAVYTIEAM